MFLYMHNITTGEVDVAPVQAEGGDYLYVEPVDLPPWANACSANYALVLYYLDEGEGYVHNDVLYFIRPTLPLQLQRTQLYA